MILALGLVVGTKRSIILVYYVFRWKIYLTFVNSPLDGTTTSSAQRFKRFHVPFTDSGITRSQTILDIALEDDAIAFGETECLIGRLQGIAIGGEAGENGGICGAAIVVNDLEAGACILGHGNA